MCLIPMANQTIFQKKKKKLNTLYALLHYNMFPNKSRAVDPSSKGDRVTTSGGSQKNKN